MLTAEGLKSEHSERSEELKRVIQQKESQLQAYRKEHGKLELFFEEVLNAIVPIQERPPIVVAKATHKGENIVPVMHITDTHVGAVQHSNEIEGFGEFSPALARSRSLKFAEETIKWVAYQRMAYNINDLAILVTGDLISGDIHDNLMITNAFPSPVQVAESSSILAEQISLLAPHFRKITVHFIVEDNHSRLTKKPQSKEAGLNSFNYLVGIMTKAYVQALTNVEMNVYPMLEKVVNVNERLYLITHGHTVKGWMGVPWYGVERKVNKEAASRLQIIMQEHDRIREIGFHKYVFGHYHTPFDTDLYSCGASLSGTDAYDHQCGRYGRPAQSAWLVHPKHGEFNRINFVLG